jgi:hypothetical protein
MSADDCRARVGQNGRQSDKVADQKVSEWLLKAECGLLAGAPEAAHLRHSPLPVLSADERALHDMA